MTRRRSGVDTCRLSVWLILVMLSLSCGDDGGHGSGVVVRVARESYGGNPNAVIASASDPVIDGVVGELSCSLAGGTCTVEFGPPSAPVTIDFGLDVDPNSEQSFRSLAVWGGDCGMMGEVTVLEPREYVCRAGLFTRQGLSQHHYREAFVRCSSAGVVCAPRYEVHVVKHAPDAQQLSLSIITPGSQCSDLIFRIFRDDLLVVTSEPLAAHQTTGATFMGPIGTQFKLGIEAEVVPGGCQGSVLLEWHALFKLVGDASVT